MKSLVAAAAMLLASQAGGQALAQDCRELCCPEAAGTELCIPLCERTCRNRIRICALGFEAVTEAVILAQPLQSAGAKTFVEKAVSLVRASGVEDSDLLDDVQVRICKLHKGTGMAPDRDTICLSDSFYFDGNVLGAAITLAHELAHSRQYRILGADRFRCEYSLEYVRCKACQDEGNRFEKEAYERQAEAEKLIRHFRATGRQPVRK